MATPRKKNPQKAGRKSSFKPEFVKQAYKFSLLGLTEKRMAELFDVSEKTFNEWKKRRPEFRKSLREGQEFADSEVAAMLIERATGYKYQEAVPIKVKEVKYENGKRVREWERVEVTMVDRVVPPDPTAIKYFMNNRRRRRDTATETPEDAAVWAERHEVDHTTKGEKIPQPVVYLPADMTVEETGITDTPPPTPVIPQ